MKKSLFILLILCLLSGCSLFRKVVYVPVEVKADSVYVEKIVEHKDTVKVEIPVEKLVFAAPVDSSHLETSIAVSDAWVDSLSVLHHILENKGGSALFKEVIYKDKIITVEKEKEVPVIKEVEVEKKFIPRYHKIISKLFWVLVVVLGIFVYVKIKF